MPANFFTPEDIQRLNELPERQKLLREKMARAQALGQPSGQKYETWGGALAGGLGDVLGIIAGKVKEKDIEDQLAKEMQGAQDTRGRVLKKALGLQDKALASVPMGPTGSSGIPEYSPFQEPSKYPPPSGSTGSNLPGQKINGTYYLTPNSQNPQGLTGQMIDGYRPSPSVIAAQDRNPEQMATMLATSGDPTFQALGGLQLHEIRRQQERAQQLEDYGRTREDKLSDVTSTRTYESAEKEKDRASRERAAAAEKLWDIKLAGMTDTRREEEERRKQAQQTEKERRGATVPGMDIAPGAEPTVEDARKMKLSVAAAVEMEKYIDELQGLHAKYGTEYGGPAGNRMEQLSNAITIKAKDIAGLGAIQAPDKPLLEGLTQADPGSFGANLKGTFGVDNTQSALKGLRKWVDDTRSSHATAFGYVPKGKPGGASVDDVLGAFGKK